MATQVREEIAKAVEQRGIECIHLFVSIPRD